MKVMDKIAAVALAASLAAAAPVAAEEMKNLKVFPADTEKGVVIDAMKQWSAALGVKCTHCHVQTVPGDFQSMDFASDEIRHKETARDMMRMVERLNSETLPRAVGGPAAAVSCVTCHRGLPDPTTLDQVMVQVSQSEGAAAAAERYRTLRERYYGSGSYDFGPRALVPAVEKLAGESRDLDGARLLVELNIEQHPDDADSRVMLGQVLLMQGDRDGAAAAAAKALEIEPGNRQAARLQKQLQQ